MRGTCLIALLLLTATGSAADTQDDLTPERRKELEKQAEARLAEGVPLFQRRDFLKAREAYAAAVEIHRTLYGAKDFPRGHSKLVNSLVALAGTYWATRDFAKAEPLFKEAVAMCRALYPREQFPAGHEQLYMSLVALGSLYRDSGQPGQAEAMYREALEMCRAAFPKQRFPRGHRELARGYGNLAALYMLTGDYAQAEPLLRQALETCRALYPRDEFPRGHADLVDAVNRLARLYYTTGDYGKAEPLFLEALALRRALHPRQEFPRGHTQLAGALNELAELYVHTGQPRKAEPLFREALEMRRALFPPDAFPRGHPDLARSVDNLACFLLETGRRDEAEPLLKEAAGLYRALYPKTDSSPGHPDLAVSLNNLASLYSQAGDHVRAEALYREALEMTRALYPPATFPGGHPQVAARMHNLACLLLEAGQPERAVALFRDSLVQYQQLLLRYADLAAEAQCLNYLAAQPLTRDGLLSATRERPDAAAVYGTLWEGRAVLTRLQERRHRDLLASRDRDTADLGDRLRRTRQDLAQRLLSAVRDRAAWQADVDRLTEAKEELEKRVAARLDLAPPPAGARPTPAALSASRPAGTAYVDLYRYEDWGRDGGVRGAAGTKHTPRYVAFVLRRGGPPVRVELTEAAPIDDAWASWHRALTAARPDERTERGAAAVLARLLWEPLRAALPADLRTVYVAPDPRLTAVPWGALPGKAPDSVLLDECAVCLVPHGPFLLERLREKAAGRAGDRLVAYGGIDYAGGPAPTPARDDVRGPQLSEKRRLRWADLPGTAREREQVVALATKRLREPPIARSGPRASTRQLEEDLPRARYAHLATHGFFADREFRSALQVEPGTFERLSPDRRGGARSPLVLSGLVLAGANRDAGDAAPDRGIITAEGLIGLRLEGMDLAVLSACETALGEDGGGEGVYGLARAFHVAGCRNVIASLWKVDDGATQALMALFYRNLWEKKLDAAEALRQAQLTLYRHPEAVTVAQKRGIDFTESDLPKTEEKPAERPRHAPAAQWAAFTFSGVRPVGAVAGP
jgi:CHAT domain-containing protein/Tfp pilus assembly protein PilF